MSNSFVTPWTVAREAPLCMGFSRQEHWSGLPFPSPGDLSDLEIERGSPVLQANSLPTEPPGRPFPSYPPLIVRDLNQRVWVFNWVCNSATLKSFSRLDPHPHQSRGYRRRSLSLEQTLRLPDFPPGSESGIKSFQQVLFPSYSLWSHQKQPADSTVFIITIVTMVTKYPSHCISIAHHLNFIPCNTNDKLSHCDATKCHGLSVSHFLLVKKLVVCFLNMRVIETSLVVQWVAKILHSQFWGPRFDPWSEN